MAEVEFANPVSFEAGPDADAEAEAGLVGFEAEGPRGTSPTFEVSPSTRPRSRSPQKEPEPEPEPEPSGFVHWWKEHQQHKRELANHDVKFGMNPFVRIKCGRHGDYASTKDIMSTPAEWASNKKKFLNPVWEAEHNNRLSALSRGRTEPWLYVEARHLGLASDKFIGELRLPLLAEPPEDGRTPHLLIPDPEAETEWEDSVWNLLDHDIDEDAPVNFDEEAQSQLLAKDAGGVHVRWRWKPIPRRLDGGDEESEVEAMAATQSPYHGLVEVAVLSASGLRDISAIRIADLGSFTDHTTVKLALYSFLVYLVASLIFYAFVMKWYPQDAGLFVVTTFTTVGYGNQGDYGDENGHGGHIQSNFDKIGVIFNIIFGTAVLGVVMGVAGDYAHSQAAVMRKQRAAIPITT